MGSLYDFVIPGRRVHEPEHTEEAWMDDACFFWVAGLSSFISMSDDLQFAH